MKNRNTLAHVSRRFVLGAALGGAAGHAYAKAPLVSLLPSPRPGEPGAYRGPGAEAIVEKARLTGDVAYLVADARTGAVLEQRASTLQLPPASVTKAVTALYALDKLGANYAFRTRLLATGTIQNGELRGDLILVGGGDPTLDTDALGEMAQKLKAAGVRQVRGRFLVHHGALRSIKEIDSGQPVQVGYNPSISGLNLNFNRVHFEWKRRGSSYDISLDARSGRYAPKVSTSKMRIVERRVPIYTYAQSGGVDQWTVASAALGGGGSRWLPVRRPELYAAEVFTAVARFHGVTLPNARLSTAAPRGTLLVEHRSAPLQRILRDMLKFSTNLTAEVSGLTASGGSVTSLQASAGQMTRWAERRFGLNGTRFVDHSGLGDASRLNADSMVKLLVRIGHDSGFAQLLKPIPMRNAKGEVLTNHPVKIRAKTGTLNFASSLAGYMKARDGRDLAFAILSADLPRRSRIAPGQDRPDGVATWRTRARRLQMALIDRWGAAYVS